MVYRYSVSLRHVNNQRPTGFVKYSLSRSIEVPCLESLPSFYSLCSSQVMCVAWIRFEEEYGTLEDYDRAVLKVGFLVKLPAIPHDH